MPITQNHTKKSIKNANNCFAHPLRRAEVETEWKTTLILE